MSAVTLKIHDDGQVEVERNQQGQTAYKRILANDFLQCLSGSVLRGGVSSGMLPKGAIAFSEQDDGNREVFMAYEAGRMDLQYYDTIYEAFPLPKMVFSFNISPKNRVFSASVYVVENKGFLTPTTKTYAYPFSNVSSTGHICTGSNRLPSIFQLHQLSGLPHYILSMPNNNDSFSVKNNQKNYQMRDLMEYLKDKKPSDYYDEILVESKATLGDIIK